MGRLLKFCGLIIVLIVLAAGICPAAPPPVTHHQLAVRLEPAWNRLEAVDVITVSNTRASRLEFNLAEHLSVGRITLNDEVVPFSFKRGKIRIPLTSARAPYTIHIEYDGVFDDEVPADPLNTDNPGFGVTGTISKEGTMLLAGAQWHPHLRLRGAVSTYDITVDAPEGVLAITSGRTLGHATDKGRSISRWKVEHPLRGVPLVAGPYTVTTLRFGSVEAATYFSKPLQHLSSDYIDAVGRYLQLYEELFGPYPFEQFAVVENSFPTGYGFPSFTLLGRRVLQLPFIIHTSLGHEIAHCWWGNGVLVDPSQGNWSEGLTTYVADYLYKERRGQGRSHRLQWLRNYAGLVDEANDFPPAEFVSRTDPATKVVGYDKTAMVFHMLRRKVGEGAFWQALRDVYARHRFKAANWSDFQKAFEERSGMPLESFFDQWVFMQGAPRLAFSSVNVTATEQGYQVQGRVLQQSPYYDLPLELVLETEQGTVTHNLQVSGAQSPFTITSDRLPLRLTADPDVHLFRRLSPVEVPPTVNSIKGAPSVSVVVARDLDPSAMKLARRLSAAMGLSKVRIGREEDFTARELDASDLLFIGKPARKEGTPVGGRQFVQTPKGFVLNGETYAGEQASFFGVFPHPADNARTAALFIPGSLAVAKSLSTKIPHYGKYSYLVFNETRNQVKGTWKIENSPLSVHWPADVEQTGGGNEENVFLGGSDGRHNAGGE